MDITHECIEWDGPLNGDFYGKVSGKSEQYAHRMVWAEEHGPIPNGMVVRHKCDNPPCILLDHLEIGTQADNIRDMFERTHTPKTHCLRGHELAGDNLGTHSQGHRFCRTCHKIHNDKRARKTARRKRQV